MAVNARQNWQYVGSSALTGGEVLKWSAKGQCDLSTADTDVKVGVAAQACPAGNVTPQNISVYTPGNCPGTVQVIAGAVIAAGAKLMPSTGGKVITATTGKLVLGFADEAAAADGDTIEMIWNVGLVAVP